MLNKGVNEMAKIKFEARIKKLVPLFVVNNRREDISLKEMAKASEMSERTISRLTTKLTALDPEERPLNLSKHISVFALTGLEALLTEKGPVPKKAIRKQPMGKVQKQIASSKKLQEEALKKMMKQKF